MKRTTNWILLILCGLLCACSENSDEQIESKFPFEKEQVQKSYNPTVTWSKMEWKGDKNVVEIIDSPDDLRKFSTDNEILSSIDWDTATVIAGYVKLPDTGYEIRKQELKEYIGGYVQVLTAVKTNENAYTVITGHTFISVYPKLSKKPIWSVVQMEKE